MAETTLYIGADHGGFELKQALIEMLSKNADIRVEDKGTYSLDSVDYPDIADNVTAAIQANPAAVGVLCCGSGIGISMRANRHKGIRAALVHSVETAQLSKQHNNANILCLGGRTTSIEDATQYVQAWLDTAFEGDRHERRIKKLDS